MSDTPLYRWSKQKSQAIEEKKIAEDEESKVTASDEDTEQEEESQKTEDSEPVELPPLESLGDDSDYSMFMSSEVDEKLKKLALKKLFKAAFFNIPDGLNDYDEDFTTFEELGDIVTCDMKFHEERKKAELEQQKLEAAAEKVEEPEQVDTVASEEDDEKEEHDEIESHDESEEVQVAEQDSADENENTPAS